jgi:activator of 2-hydroxyglutaryl-CoA dehydratase
LEEFFECEVKVPEDPQMVGAYGTAIIAQDSGK